MRASGGQPKAGRRACYVRWQTVLGGRPPAECSMVINENRLIAGLPRVERSSLLSICTCVPLDVGVVLSESGDLTRHVYFPTRGFISLVAAVDGVPKFEVGMVGREGMLGVQVALGVSRAPLHALVQGAGSAYRATAADFCRRLEDSPALQAELDRYVCVVMMHLATSAGCARYHDLKSRLARWLLMSQDRAQADAFHLTQEFLAYMLGVRRVGITLAAGDFQRRGLLRYHRGEITVLDRAGLEAAACSCYEADRSAYEGVLTRHPRSN